MRDKEKQGAEIVAHLIVAITEFLLMVFLNNRFGLGFSYGDLAWIYLFIKLLFR